MIYTNNIQETAKEIEQKLNEKLGSSSVKVFTVTYSNMCLYIEVFWMMSLEELEQIHKILRTNAFVTDSVMGNAFKILVCYEKGGE